MQSNEPKRVLGERGRIRTCDPCLKRALLYQLSYAPSLGIHLSKLLCPCLSPGASSSSGRAIPLDARVPGIASFRKRGAQTLAELLQIVGDSQMSDEFHALVPELARQPSCEAAAVAHGK